MGNYSFNVPTTSGFQLHHIIPNAVFDQSQLLTDLTQSGLYNQADFLSNGVSLPSTVDGAEALGESLHSGPHNAYSDYVEAGLNQIEGNYTNLRESLIS